MSIRVGPNELLKRKARLDALKNNKKLRVDPTLGPHVATLTSTTRWDVRTTSTMLDSEIKTTPGIDAENTNNVEDNPKEADQAKSKVFVSGAQKIRAHFLNLCSYRNSFKLSMTYKTTSWIVSSLTSFTLSSEHSVFVARVGERFVVMTATATMPLVRNASFRAM